MVNLAENQKLNHINLSMAIIRKRRKTKTVIYIACEGTKTEYHYFEALKEFMDNELVELRIYPDESDLLDLVPPSFIAKKHKKGSKKVEKPIQGVKTDPRSLCDHVIEKCKREDGIDEGWIVLDKDGHAHLSQVFEKAEKADIRIAFSSIAFEHWLLLHFESNTTPFAKSDCKDKNGRYLKCGQASHENDCKGMRCVASHIRMKKYIADYDKKATNLFEQTHQHLSVAFKNAAYLRTLYQKEAVTYDKNPYTDVDVLVKRLLDL
jgi:RloB-like protein